MFKSFLLLAVCFFVFPLSSQALEITFLSDAKVNGAQITLGDIAKFNEESPLAEAIATKHVHISPKPGMSTSLNAGEIKTKFINNLPPGSSIEWKGASVVNVTRNGVTINPDDIEAAIAEYLDGRSSDLPAADYLFIPRELPLPFMIPTGQLDIDVIPATPNVLGSRRFSLIYKVDNKTVKNLSIRGKLEAMAPVAVLSQNVKRGAILNPTMVRMQTKDLSKLRTPCTNLREVLGKKLTRSLRTGSVLDLSSIDFPPLIRKGQLVKMVVSHNGMLLTAKGIASMNGKKDQIIRVLNSGSRKEIFCRVAAPGLVEVQI
ncbi:MAG TPA: flagellar basal body P-ring formation protein FlgA [Desulfobacterales bacterium]|nr:flagellar basal body P-ring formation protein FlgA [Desulfobacterales bacterium]HIP39811.1 flagellar basal body P-ring formation protein FlgA [Desulfocapsa sulfexigens]